MKSDIEWIQELIEKAKNRDLGINSINYYYLYYVYITK